MESIGAGRVGLRGAIGCGILLKHGKRGGDDGSDSLADVDEGAYGGWNG